MAVDQRKSLRRLIAEAGSTSLESVSDAQLATFKTAVAEVLSPYASAVLFDPEYGLGAAQARAKECGLLLAYEADGYENPRPNRMLALMPRLSVRHLRDMGADGIKILLHYTPEDTSAVNEEKCALIERIGNECRALDMPFFFEPIVYDPAVPAIGAKQTEDEKFEFAKRKPAIVIETMREFSKDIYHIDILKVEFPVVASYVEGSATYKGPSAYSMDTALAWYRAADATARRPYIYLSAGVSTSEFLASIRLATDAGTRFSGVLCGRATWQEAIPAYAQSGRQALYKWLETSGIENIQALNGLLERATPWQEFYSGEQG